MIGPMDHGALMPQDHQSESVRRRLEAMRLQERLNGPAGEKRERQLREASQDFEAIFLNQMIKQMRANVPKEGLLNSKDEQFWQSHFDTEMAVLMARQGGIGLGDMIFEQLRETQIKASQATAPPSEGMPAMTLLAPFNPATSDKTSPDDDDPDLMALTGEDDPDSGRGPHAPAAEGQADYSSMPGTYGVMGIVRSLARSIEERGGVVPEHPGALDMDIDPLDTRNSTVSLPPMKWPLNSRVSSGFGWRPDPFTGERAWHAGIDLAAPVGTPVQAAWDGKVVFVGRQGGYGQMVVLEHAGGWRTFYAHNNTNNVKVGEQVQAGQTIATVGASGRATGPHLHFEIRQDNMAWDPKQIRDRLLAGLPIGRQETMET